MSLYVCGIKSFGSLCSCESIPMKEESVDIYRHILRHKCQRPRFLSNVDVRTCSEGDANEDGGNEGSITPVRVELVYQGDEEDAKGVGDSVG